MPPRRRKPPFRPRQPEQTHRQDISGEQELLIGRAVVTWSRIEKVVEEVSWALLRLPVDEGRIVTSRLDAKYKINLLRELGKKHFTGEHLIKITEILNKIEDLYIERNLIVHGEWVTINGLLRCPRFVYI
jgi:hypothetical protein